MLYHKQSLLHFGNRSGLPATIETVKKLYAGANTGKLMIRVKDV
jgi:hypothetical protein